MSTVPHSVEPRAARAGTSPIRGTVALGALVALAVMIAVTIALASRGTASSSRRAGAPHTSYAPVIQYRGTGAPPVPSSAPRTTEGRATTDLHRTRHSYGAV
jgi:hypothetical protein